MKIIDILKNLTIRQVTYNSLSYSVICKLYIKKPVQPLKTVHRLFFIVNSFIT